MRLSRPAVFVALLGAFAACNAEDFDGPVIAEDVEDVPNIVPSVKAIPYVAPDVSGLFMAELFDDELSTNWVVSTKEKFTGNWEKSMRKVEAVLGDAALRLNDAAKHHAISRRLPAKLEMRQGKEFAVSYEVKFEDGLSCGGAYLKLFDSNGMDLADFDNDVPYVVMFGPDRCGATNKVHLIIRHKNPVSGKWEEKHLKNPPLVPSDEHTHSYSLSLKPDNTYQVLVDGAVRSKGSLDSDFEPAFSTPEEIDDPEDRMPSDWVLEKKIADPDAKRPDDWQEGGLAEMPDSTAVMPEGWLEDEAVSIPSEDAAMPDDWDEEEDGEWVAPMIPNPKCTVGCGVWKRPMIPNPNYMGKWTAPLIDNPAYKGEWFPRKIKNPAFHVEKVAHALPAMDAVGFELWTMQGNMLFDNIVVAESIDAMTKFLANTFSKRSEIEVAMAPKPEAEKTSAQSTLEMLAEMAVTSPIRFALGGISGLLFVATLLMRMYSWVVKPAKFGADKSKEAEKKKDDDVVTTATAGDGTDEDESSEEVKEKEEKPKPRKRGKAARAE